MENELFITALLDDIIGWSDENYDIQVYTGRGMFKARNITEPEFEDYKIYNTEKGEHRFTAENVKKFVVTQEERKIEIWVNN